MGRLLKTGSLTSTKAPQPTVNPVPDPELYKPLTLLHTGLSAGQQRITRRNNKKFHQQGNNSQLFRIDNYSSLETQAQEQESNPDPGSPWAARPVDCRTACPRFSGIEPPQADTKNVGPCSETGQNKEIIAPNGRLIPAPNRGTEAATISFMNLKSTPLANQEPSPERGTAPQPNLMTTTLKQVNQVANLIFLTNERTPRPSAVLLPLDLSTQSPWACLSQCPDEPPMENVKF
ncbi:hypothetical protein DSO57_1005081 [Entomophthora muscae]|uniref:Uncharacterized protein n=1 Tax=Entomophthora muscae TaxID=34485 RepID=A0ACC2RMN8_9FUNG|nr:hypothetical protein DSO57_1005081 [Entomophthora muscae]